MEGPIPGDVYPSGTDITYNDDGSIRRVKATGRAEPAGGANGEATVNYRVEDGHADMKSVELGRGEDDPLVYQSDFTALYGAAEAAKLVAGVESVDDPGEWIAEAVAPEGFPAPDAEPSPATGLTADTRVVETRVAADGGDARADEARVTIETAEESTHVVAFDIEDGVAVVEHLTQQGIGTGYKSPFNGAHRVTAAAHDAVRALGEVEEVDTELFESVIPILDGRDDPDSFVVEEVEAGAETASVRIYDAERDDDFWFDFHVDDGIAIPSAVEGIGTGAIQQLDPAIYSAVAIAARELDARPEVEGVDVESLRLLAEYVA